MVTSIVIWAAILQPVVRPLCRPQSRLATMTSSGMKTERAVVAVHVSKARAVSIVHAEKRADGEKRAVPPKTGWSHNPVRISPRAQNGRFDEQFLHEKWYG